MMPRAFWLKRIFLVGMVCAMVCAQFSALALENEHHHSSQHCCTLCHVGLPFLQPAVAVNVPPVLSVVWLAAFVDQDIPHQHLLAQASSRAPPAFPLA
jgi:hypothetical protein